MDFLEGLSQSDLVRWVAESDYGYPWVLTAHAIGMAFVVGIMLVFDLRVLGLATQIPLSVLRRFFIVAWIGFAINLTSGTLLFLANYTAFIKNTAFITKISLLIVGALGTWGLTREIYVRSPIVTGSAGIETTTQRARMFAAILVVIWLGAITAGRIVGYTDVPE